MMAGLFRNTLIALFALSLASCGSAGRRQNKMLHNLVQKGEYEKAENLVKGKDFFNEKESALLKLLELGMVQQLQGKYDEALKTFEAAQELSDKLFTVSISKKVKAAVTNSNFDNYYGEKYERSMIRYYLSLNHFLLAQKGEDDKQKRFHLQASKAVLLEWNSLLDSYKATSGGVVAYKDDLLAKTFGGFVHEHAGSRTDRRIALNLYKEAKKVLFKVFNTLETYNAKSDKFKEDLKKLSQMPLKKVEKDYVSRTQWADQLLNFLDQRIESLQKGKKEEALVVIESGFIAPKVAKKIDFPIPAALMPVKTNKRDFLSFSSRMLALSAGSLPKIYFELPKVPYSPVNGEATLEVRKEGKPVLEKPLVIVNPLANLASMIMEEKSGSLYTKIGTRLATKHITALVAAYGIYKLTKKKSGDFLANAAAALSYAASNKAIEASERADLRNWSLLPHHYRITTLDLDSGLYELVLKLKEGERQSQKILGTVDIKKGEGKVLTFRAF